MKLYLTTILLDLAIALIALGIHINNFILVCIGGFLAGVYNSMMYKKRLKKK